MKTEIPEWVRVALRHWGHQKRRVWEGRGNWYMDKNGIRQVHIDGYSDSFMGALMEDREGAGQGCVRQRWEEVYWGDGLEVLKALPGLPETPNDALHVRYVWNPECGLVARQKAALIGLKERAYWEAVGRAEYWIWARLEGKNPAHTQVLDASEKIIQLPLRRAKSSGTHTTHTVCVPKVSVPQLNYAALKRSKLRLQSG